MSERIGRYKILEQVGEGGFAIVHRAVDTQLEREVALKELRPLLLNDTGWVYRFRREARAIAKLDHPNIVPIYDVYQTEDRLFLVMRLVKDASLDELIIKRKRVSWSETVEIISAVAGGLDYAHSQGILHRDLKPANILIDAQRGPMLTDFGLAKLAGENSMSISASGSIVGTPHYIAPEVWEGKGSIPQSDIYALGCILCEMLTGEKIFKGTTAPVVMMAHFQPLTLPTVWPQDVPDGLSAVLTKALANTPTDRYATAAEMVRDLKQLSRITEPQPVSQQKEPPVADTPATEHVKQRLKESSVTTKADDLLLSTFSDEDEDEDDGPTWHSFFAHLGPYIFVIGALAIINAVTGGSSPWFLFPAIAWGVGLAFHLRNVVFRSMLRGQGKWHKFFNHLSAYVIVIGALGLLNAVTNSNEPWFLWPALGWGIGLGVHFWATLIHGDDKTESTHRRLEKAAERRYARKIRQKIQSGVEEKLSRLEGTTDTPAQNYLSKARAYKEQINTLIKSTTNAHIQPQLQELSNQVNDWTQAIEDLSRRVTNFQQNKLIHQDLKTVPQFIKKLEEQLLTETDPTTRAELERTLANRKNQLNILRQLENTMKRAELKIENTLSLLGTIYPQILTSQSTNQVSDYSRISAKVNEEMHALQDHLEALEEVKFGETDFL